MSRVDEHKFPICVRCRKLIPMDSIWLECDKCIQEVFPEK